jgi:hypothetical protein
MEWVTMAENYSNVREIIFGRLADQLVDVFGQINKVFGPKEKPSWDESPEPLPSIDNVLNAWEAGKSGAEISRIFHLPTHKVTRMLDLARFNGDPRAVYRAGWAQGKVPGKLQIVPKGDK